MLVTMMQFFTGQFYKNFRNIFFFRNNKITFHKSHINFVELYECHIAHNLSFYLTTNDILALKYTCQKMAHLITMTPQISREIKLTVPNNNMIIYNNALKYMKNNNIAVYFYEIHFRVKFDPYHIDENLKFTDITIKKNYDSHCIEVFVIPTNINITLFWCELSEAKNIATIGDFYYSLQILTREFRKCINNFKITSIRIENISFFTDLVMDYENNDQIITFIKKEFDKCEIHKSRNQTKIYLCGRYSNIYTSYCTENISLFKAKNYVDVCSLHLRLKKCLNS